jgi:regulatory protein
MIVTKIERQKKDPDRYSLYLDGAFAIGIRSAVLLRAGLRKGDELSPETLDGLRGDEEAGAARAAALRFAGRRRRTEHEVREKLASLEFPPALIDAVIGPLRDSGVLDDRAYVRAYIHDAQMRRPAGPRMIAFRLRGKGLPPDLLREEIEAALGPAAEIPLAVQLARRYHSRLLGREAAGRVFAVREREAAIRRYLTGRGFGRAAVDAAVRSVAPRDPTED